MHEPIHIFSFVYSATVTTLQNKLESTMTVNTLMKEDLAISKNTILELQVENIKLQAEKEYLLQQHQKTIKVRGGGEAVGIS